ncbi:MAG: AmmeMemoRadiSam system radical SAM enzyme [Deltaproteobacteria bacterium]|nr:AmmeMemoRadiSam system radical SAM enzyme [Deltaproteobacteria bacterium]
MREAELYTKLPGNRVRCELCAHHCRLRPGQRGICGVRQNRAGTLLTAVADLVIAAHVDPIEKKPFYHVLPGSKSYSIAAPGCNFICRHCQNHEISQMPRGEKSLAGQRVDPAVLVRQAQAAGCRSIAYTYTEPTVYSELMHATATLAREQGLLNLMVTNGYLTAAARRRLEPLVQAANVDLKAWSDSFYRRICGAAGMTPVLDTIGEFVARGIWVEVTTLLIPGYNDNESELKELARFLVSVSPALPWHVSGFFPTYRLTGVPPTPPETLKRARDIGLAAGLRYVFEGNRPGVGGENSCCHHCGEVLIERYGYKVLSNKISEKRCPRCRTPVAGLF